MFRSLALILLILFPALPAAATSIVFHDHCTVSGDVVTLGSLAVISAAKAEKEHLAALPLVRMPIPGSDQSFNRDELWQLLLRRAPELANLQPAGADQVAVHRKGVTIGSDAIRTLLETYLASQQNRFPTAKLSLAELTPIRPLVLPAGTIRSEVHPADPDLLQSRSFAVIFTVDGQVEANLNVRARLQAWAEVPCVIGDLPRGTLLDAAHIRWQKQDLCKLRQPLDRTARLVGMRLTRSLRSGDVIERNMLEIPPLIKRGDRVVISVEKGQLHLTAAGVARSNGLPGGTIQVRNNDSQRDILCKVTGPGAVRVEF